MPRGEIVPVEYLLHLINNAKKMPKEQAARLRDLAPMADVSDRETLYSELKSFYPNLADDLASMWSFVGRVSVHLFKANIFIGKTSASVAKAVRELAGAGPTDNVILPPKRRGQDGTARVFRVTLSRTAVDAVVRIKKPITWQSEREQSERTVDVMLRINFKRDDRMVEVYANYSDARKALITFLGWITGASVPTRSGPAQAEFFEPLGFREAHAKTLTVQLGGRPFTLRGPDAEDDFEEQQYWSKLDGGKRKPLDIANTKVRAQELLVNHVRGVEFDVPHANGYQETVDILFNFKGHQPRLIFQRRTSREAMDRLLEALSEIVHPT